MRIKSYRKECYEHVSKKMKECINQGFYPASYSLFLLYMRNNNMSAISINTKIPYQTVYRHIKKVKKEMVDLIGNIECE